MWKSKGKLIVSGLCFVAALVFSGEITAYARQEFVLDSEEQYGVAFDAQYYGRANPDVVAMVGNSAKALYDHYKYYGEAEGRTYWPVLSNISEYTVTPVDLTMYAGQWTYTFWDLKDGIGGVSQIIGWEFPVVGITSNGFYQIDAGFWGYDYIPVGELYSTKEEAMATYIPTDEEMRNAQFIQTYGKGSDLAFTGTYTLPNSKFEMPLLNKFNTAGLNPHPDNYWFGISTYLGDVPIEEQMGGANAKIFEAATRNLAERFDELGWRELYSSTGFIMDSLGYIWDKSSHASVYDLLCLYDIKMKQPDYWKNEGYYTLIIRSPLDYAAELRMGYASPANENEILASQDALAVLLSLVSTTPVELQKAILDTVYYTPAGQEPISTDFQWCQIGDCRIRLGGYDYTDGNHITTFHIAPLEDLGSLKQN